MIRNFLFSLFFFSGIIFISLIFLPAIFLPKKIVLFGGKIMGFWTSLCLKTFLSTKIIIKGKENIINGKKFFIAASHQSMFETFFLQTIFNSPVFILKKELLMIPIFGWYLKALPASDASIRYRESHPHLSSAARTTRIPPGEVCLPGGYASSIRCAGRRRVCR